MVMLDGKQQEEIVKFVDNLKDCNLTIKQQERRIELKIKQIIKRDDKKSA